MYIDKSCQFRWALLQQLFPRIRVRVLMFHISVFNSIRCIYCVASLRKISRTRFGLPFPWFISSTLVMRLCALDYSQNQCPVPQNARVSHFPKKNHPPLLPIATVEALLCNCDRYRSGLGSSTCAYLRYVQAQTSIEDILASLKCSAPTFRMCVECYHYQKCELTKYYADRKGNQKSHTRTEKRKVVTHTATSCIQYGAWKDCSTKVGKLKGSKVVRIKFEKDYEFHDEETYNSFVHQRLHFQRANDFDEYQAYSEEFVLPEFTDMVICSQHGGRPCCMNMYFYILASIFTLSYPYRMWLSNISEDKIMDIRKRVSASPLAMKHLTYVQKYLQPGDTATQKAVIYQVGRVARSVCYNIV